MTPQVSYDSIKERLRADLTWQELAKQIALFHKLKTIEHGGHEKPGHPKSGKTGWTIRQTASELGYPIGQVSESISLVKYMDAYPEITNSKDRKTAVDLMRTKKIQTEINEDLKKVVKGKQCQCQDPCECEYN